MTNSPKSKKGETTVYKDKLTLVKELAEMLGEEIVVQCPNCGMPHKKVEAEDLSAETVNEPCPECKKILDFKRSPIRRLS